MEFALVARLLALAHRSHCRRLTDSTEEWREVFERGPKEKDTCDNIRSCCSDKITITTMQQVSTQIIHSKIKSNDMAHTWEEIGKQICG